MKAEEFADRTNRVSRAMDNQYEHPMDNTLGKLVEVACFPVFVWGTVRRGRQMKRFWKNDPKYL